MSMGWAQYSESSLTVLSAARDTWEGGHDPRVLELGHCCHACLPARQDPQVK